MEVIENMMTDSRGQSTFFDAFVFFIIMLIASTFAFYYSGELKKSGEVWNSTERDRYCAQSAGALMESTICKCWYEDKSNHVIWLPPASTNVADLLVAEMSLLDDGVQRGNFNSVEPIKVDGINYYSVENSINITARNLIKGTVHFGILCVYGNPTAHKSYTVFITDGAGIPQDRSANPVALSMAKAGKPGSIALVFYIW